MLELDGIGYMAKHIIKKLLRVIIVLLGVSVFTFSLTYFIQGNPAEIKMAQSGIEADKEDIKNMEIELGIDKPITEQYLSWLSNIIKMDFGNSYITGKPVIEELAYRFPATITLTVSSFIFMVIFSIAIGVLSVIKRHTIFDGIIQLLTFVFMGIPAFVLGLMLAYIVSVKLKLLPMIGNKTISSTILPVLTLSIPMSCRYIRLIRSNIIDTLDEDYIFLLRTKGIREGVILFGNALKNAFIPVVNIMGISLGSLLGGSVVVENIFSWPGLGSYLMSSINNRDYPVVLAYVIIMAVIFVVINYVVDIIVCILDPRIPAGGEGIK